MTGRYIGDCAFNSKAKPQLVRRKTNTTKTNCDLDIIVRAADRTRLEFPGLGITEELLSPDLAGPLEMLISTFEPGADSDDYTHDGDEAGLVIEGVLDLWVNGAHHVLKRGDSFSFPSTRVHRCANTSALTTRVLWVIPPPHY